MIPGIPNAEHREALEADLRRETALLQREIDQARREMAEDYTTPWEDDSALDSIPISDLITAYEAGKISKRCFIESGCTILELLQTIDV